MALLSPLAKFIIEYIFDISQSYANNGALDDEKLRGDTVNRFSSFNSVQRKRLAGVCNYAASYIDSAAADIDSTAAAADNTGAGSGHGGARKINADRKQ